VGENIHRVTTAINLPHEQKKRRKKEDGWVSDDRVRTTRRKEYIKKNQ
jgi:hypothetical protein